MCFSTIGLKGVPNILLQILPQKCFQPAEPKHGFNSVRWIHISQSQFTDSFFLLLLWGYLIFQHRPPWAPKYALANSRESVFPTRESKERFNSVRCIQSRKAVSQIVSLLHGFSRGDNLVWTTGINGLGNVFPHTQQKEHFQPADSHTHTQTNKEYVLRWQINPDITKQIQWNILSGLCLGIFSLSP